MKNMWHDCYKNAFHRIFLSWIAHGKIFKCPGNPRENSGNLAFQKCGHLFEEYFDVRFNENTIPQTFIQFVLLDCSDFTSYESYRTEIGRVVSELSPVLFWFSLSKTNSGCSSELKAELPWVKGKISRMAMKDNNSWWTEFYKLFECQVNLIFVQFSLVLLW